MSPRPAVTKAFDTLAALCYPQDSACHSCGQPLLGNGELLLCANCRDQLQRDELDATLHPFFLNDWIPLSFAAYFHHGIARRLVHRLKYGDDHWAALPLAEGMAAVFALVEEPALRRVDLLAPVPLHPRRQRYRGYNQAELLGRQLAFHTGLPLFADVLRRIRHTRPQVMGNQAQRQHNMLGAFEVTNPGLVYQKRVLLLDDVCTTGSTAAACAQVLHACGAQEVVLLTACKA